jgi:hypothetical protein
MKLAYETTASRSPVAAGALCAALLCGTAGLACFAGCKSSGDGKRSAENSHSHPDRVPQPLKNPAGFCFSSCRRQATCRLGEPHGKEQKKIFETDIKRCSHRCVDWIKTRPYDAAALHTCYTGSKCGKLMACLADTRRLLRHTTDPTKKRQCFKLCVDMGQCGGDEPRCLKMCNRGDLRVYRALERCENRGCPRVRECVEEQLTRTR